jgi:hypothetical protein
MDNRHGHDHNEDNRTHSHGTQLRFLQAWFKHGEDLTPFQRTLFMLLSLVLLSISGTLLYGLIDAIRTNGNVGASLAGFIGMGVPMLAIAIFGLRNVLRFRKKDERRNSSH